MFLKHKDETFDEFSKLCKRIQNEKGTSVCKIWSDHGAEFENEIFKSFCESNDIKHKFSFPQAAPQNGVERKNRTLQECAQTLLVESSLLSYFWAEAVNTVCYILNRTLIRSILKKTPYELYYYHIPKISHF